MGKQRRVSIPNAHLAVIDRRKIVDYLLSAEHPVGRFKAQFFARLGFTADRIELLSEALKHILTDQTDTGY